MISQGVDRIQAVLQFLFQNLSCEQTCRCARQLTIICRRRVCFSFCASDSYAYKRSEDTRGSYLFQEMLSLLFKDRHILFALHHHILHFHFEIRNLVVQFENVIITLLGKRIFLLDDILELLEFRAL